jgi:hypothetical protein
VIGDSVVSVIVEAGSRPDFCPNSLPQGAKPAAKNRSLRE